MEEVGVEVEEVCSLGESEGTVEEEEERFGLFFLRAIESLVSILITSLHVSISFFLFSSFELAANSFIQFTRLWIPSLNVPIVSVSAFLLSVSVISFNSSTDLF